jgi:DNA-binding Lrp family transcriptional regulator
MITAIVLLNVARPQVNAVAEALAEMAGISEVYSVTGELDLVALVTERVVAVSSIEKITTMLAFNA